MSTGKFPGFLNATEQEWTQVKLLEMYLADDSFKSIADAINNAVDKVVADDAEIIVELEAELAAEKSHRKLAEKEWVALTDQLDAEWGKVRHLENQQLILNDAIKQRDKQLAAVREQLRTLVDALKWAIARMDRLLDDASGEHSDAYKNAKATLKKYQ